MEVVDFMPVSSRRYPNRPAQGCAAPPLRLGEMTCALDIAPRFGYGREPNETQVSDNGAVSRARLGN
jgi:hypothetical protein